MDSPNARASLEKVAAFDGGQSVLLWCYAYTVCIREETPTYPMANDTTQNDDLETVVEKLRTHHNSAKVVTYENAGYDEHIGYYDKGGRGVACGALSYVQEQGFEIIQAGTNYLHEVDEKKGWMEAVR